MRHHGGTVQGRKPSAGGLEPATGNGLARRMGFLCRTASVEELGTILDWAAAEGWNPGLADAPCFYAADPAGFFVGELDGRLVSAISAVRYGAEFGFVGLYIVHPDFRGRGYGWATWQHALGPLAKRNLGLDGVVAQQAAYAKSGFTRAHRSVRYRIEAGPGMGLEGRGGRAIGPEAMPAIAAFDRRFFPAEREAFLQAWLTQPEVQTCCVERGGRLRAYGAMRRCREGWKIGPLFAEGAVGAEEVFGALLGRIERGPVWIDVLENHAAAEAMVRTARATPVFETARMYTRGQPREVAHGVGAETRGGMRRRCRSPRRCRRTR